MLPCVAYPSTVLPCVAIIKYCVALHSLSKYRVASGVALVAILQHCVVLQFASSHRWCSSSTLIVMWPHQSDPSFDMYSHDPLMVLLTNSVDSLIWAAGYLIEGRVSVLGATRLRKSGRERRGIFWKQQYVVLVYYLWNNGHHDDHIVQNLETNPAIGGLVA